MIRHLSGDLFRSSAQVLVCPVNCVGVMGAGLARKFRERFFGLEEAYVRACKYREVDIGRVWAWQGGGAPVVVCLPTKLHWSNMSTLPIVERGVSSLGQWMVGSGHRSIAIPARGCGLGALQWADVYPLIVRKLVPLAPEWEIEVYQPLEGV